MVTWQLTATTIICKRKGSEVTITVFGDGKLACTGVEASASGKAHPACAAQECSQVKEYQLKLMAEEELG